MNAKVFSIVLTVVAALILVMVLIQKNGYVSQAQENYDKKASEYKTYGTNTTEFVNTSINMNKLAWAVACGIVEKNIATSKDQGAIERAEAPAATKGSDSFKTLVRHFEITPNYFIETTFKKVDTDKKTDLKFLSGFASLNVSALQGNPVVASDDEEDDEEEEVEEEAPAPKKAVKAKKKEAPAKKSKKRGKKR